MFSWKIIYFLNQIIGVASFVVFSALTPFQSAELISETRSVIFSLCCHFKTMIALGDEVINFGGKCSRKA